MTEQKRELRESQYRERKERERRKAKKQEQAKSAKTLVSRPSATRPEISEGTEDNTQVQLNEREILIPAVNLKKPAISFKTALLDLVYPRVKKENQLRVPKFNVYSPAFEFLNSKLDTSFSTKKGIRALAVPKIKPLKPIVEFLEDELDVNYPVSTQKREVSIPKLALQRPSLSFETTSLNAEILTPQPSHQMVQSTLQAQSENVREVDEGAVKPIQPQEEITQVPHAVEAQTEGAMETGGEELRDPLEFLFDNGAGKVRDVEPLVVLFKDHPDDSYIQTFEALLLRIYREKHGGRPEVKKLSLREDWNKQEVEQWLDEGEYALIDLDTESVEIDKELLGDRLWSIFSKRRGIVIFHTKNYETFERYERMLSRINWNKLHLGAKIVEIEEPRKLSLEKKLQLASLLFMDIKEKTVPLEMDKMLNASRGEYERKLKKLSKRYYEISGILKPGENESSEHLYGKAFIVHHLIKRLEEKGVIPRSGEKDWKLIRDTIKTEEPKDGIIVDVCFDNENYEFETLFEEGFAKIHKTLRKYGNLQANVNIVVEPITAFLHAKEFAELMRIVKQLYPTLNVGFYTLDVKNEKLKPLNDYLKELKEWVSDNPS